MIAGWAALGVARPPANTMRRATSTAPSRTAGITVAAFLLLAVVQNQDVVAAGALLGADEAGRFAVLSTLGGARRVRDHDGAVDAAAACRRRAPRAPGSCLRRRRAGPRRRDRRGHRPVRAARRRVRGSLRGGGGAGGAVRAAMALLGVTRVLRGACLRDRAWPRHGGAAGRLRAAAARAAAGDRPTTPRASRMRR